MPKTEITPVTAVFAGAEITPVNIDKTNGNEFTNVRAKSKLFIVNNSSTDSIVGTFDVTATLAEGTGSIPAQDVAVTVAAGALKVVGPFSGNFETNSKVSVAWTGAAVASDVQIFVVN